MMNREIKALPFDTGGTILDWHIGFSTALAEADTPTFGTRPEQTKAT